MNSDAILDSAEFALRGKGPQILHLYTVRGVYIMHICCDTNLRTLGGMKFPTTQDKRAPRTHIASPRLPSTLPRCFQGTERVTCWMSHFLSGCLIPAYASVLQLRAVFDH